MTADETIYELTRLSCVSIHNLDAYNAPIGFASGCIVNYKNSRFLLTVAHATGIAGQWGVQLEYDAEMKGIKYFLPQYSWLSQGKLDEQTLARTPDSQIRDLLKDFEIIDFSYAAFPVEHVAMDEYIDINAGIKYFRPKRVIETDLNARPERGDKFSFYGHVRTTRDDENKVLLLTEQYQEGMEFVDEYRESYYRFRLPQTIKNKSDYKGCSGGPILNQNGELVSLVVAGSENSSILIGINLNKFKVALDVEVNDFS